MTFLSLLSLLCRLVGLTSLAETFWQKHEAKVAQKAAVNVPVIDTDWTKRAEDGKL